MRAAARFVGRALAATGAALALGPLTGCATLFPRVEVADTRPPAPLTLTQPVRNNGAIFQSGGYRPLFEDFRARLVGDTLNVQITERVSASATSTSTIDKSGSLAGSITGLPGVKPNSFVNGRTTVGATSANSFSGSGATVNSNDFSGNITVVVREVLPNGHLLIAGEKQIGVNQNVDVLRFSGQVDPRAIQAGNTVSSTQIANVRLEQRGRGQQAESQAMGWLGRVFMTVFPF